MIANLATILIGIWLVYRAIFFIPSGEMTQIELVAAGVAVAVWLAEACVFRGRAAVSSGFLCAPCAAAVAAEPAMPCSRTAVQTPATPRTRALAISKPPRAAATAQPTAKSPSAASMVASTRARFRVDLRPRTGPRVRPDTRALRDAYTHGG